jgi:hypothetical protein
MSMRINFQDSTIETVNINTPGPAVDTGPLTEQITIPCSKRFKRLFDFVCKLTEKDLQVLGHGYLLAGILEDLKGHFEIEPYLDKTVREFLQNTHGLGLQAKKGQSPVPARELTKGRK